MSAKYHRIPQETFSDRGGGGEDGGGGNTDETYGGTALENGADGTKYRSPFSYQSIFSYERGRMFKSPYTYGDAEYSQQNSDALHLEKDNSKGGSVARNVVETMVIIFCYFAMVMTFPLSLVVCLKFVSQFERLAVFRLGRLQDAKGPGAVMVLPCIDSYKRVDMRMKAFNVPPLQAITCDGGVVELGATVFYRVKDALASVLKVQDFNKAVRNLAHSVVHRLVNKHPFQAIEKDRKILRDELQDELNKAAFGWGMEVGNVEMSDMRVIRQPGPQQSQANKAMQTLMQPQIMGQLWQAVGGDPKMAEKLGSLMAGQGVTTEVPVQHLIDLSTSPSSDAQPQPQPSIGPPPNDDLIKLVDFIQQGVSDSLADEIDQVYQIECRGLGDFYMHFRRPMVCVGVGRLEKVDVTISLERGDLIDLLSERLAPLDAYLSGRLSMTGDTKAALRMQPLATRLRPFLRASALTGSPNGGQ